MTHQPWKDPSFTFTFDPEKDASQKQVEEATVHQAGRASSTDEQFLDRELPPAIRPFVFDYNQDNQCSVWPPWNLSSEPSLRFEESLLPSSSTAHLMSTNIKFSFCCCQQQLTQEVDFNGDDLKISSMLRQSLKECSGMGMEEGSSNV